MKTFLLAVATAAAFQSPKPFQRAEIDPAATYAIHLTQASDGSWTERETFKLCSTDRKGRRGEPIKFVAVAISKDCPK